MKILAFDCAGSSCSAAVLDGAALVAHRFTATDRGQAEALMPMIAATLGEAGLEAGALDAIAVTTGPGGFTGVRIGLAAAQGLALARAIPLIGVTCFAAVVAALPEALRSEPILVALESKRDELYLQSFSPAPGIPALAPFAAWQSWMPAGRFVLAGDGAPRFAAAVARDLTLAPGPGLVDAAEVARLAASSWRPGDTPPWPRPLYLRAPDTSTPRAAAASLAR